MAATIDSGQTGQQVGDLAGNKFKNRVFNVTVGADNDTLQTGIKGISEVWWLGSSATQLATCSVSDATNGTIKFDTGGAVTGKILVRSRG